MEGAASEENPLKPGETIVMLHPLGAPIPLPPSLHPHRLGASGAAYISNILTVEEEQSLMREVREREIILICFQLTPASLLHDLAPDVNPQIYLSKNWTQLSARRLQNWGGIVRASGMREEPLPGWLMTLQPKLAHLFPCPFNHVLINEYLPGQGILVRSHAFIEGSDSYWTSAYV